MKINVSNKDWLDIPREKRGKLMEIFRFSRSGPTEVAGGVLISDGATEKDLQAFNIGAMIAFLGSELPYWKPDLCDELLTLTLNKIYGGQPNERVECNQPVGVIGTPEGNSNGSVKPSEEIGGLKPRRGGRPRKTQESV